MVIYSGVCYTQRKFFGDKDAYKMNSERLMNEQRLALLKTIRKENPSLHRYMNDIINEMENPESAFNTGKMTRPTDLDRTTAMRLCDAFAVAKMYSEKYHLDFPELIEFVSEKTLELIIQNKSNNPTYFKRRIESLIRKQFPFQNALLSRENQINQSFYDEYDEQESFNKKKQTHYDLPLELMLPILFTNNVNIAYSEMEYNLETKMLRVIINKALAYLTPREEQVILHRTGLDGGNPKDLEQTGEELGLTRERVRQIEAKAIVKLRNSHFKKQLKTFLSYDKYFGNPIGRCAQFPDYVSISRSQYNVHCDCGGKVKLKINYDERNIRRRILVCQQCNKIYELNSAIVQFT